MAETVFYILAACTVVSALGCISARNPVASVMWLVSAMFGLAGIYLLHGAEFIAVIQVLVYAGAIMVLFLFVIMLLNIGDGPADLRAPPMRVVGLAVGAVLLLELVALGRYSAGRIAVEADPLGSTALSSPTAAFPGAAQALAGTAERGVVGGIAESLFTTYLVPFEITSVLLLAAAVGAVVLAKRKI
ncbi:MAG: NADH-quinone oxidoreductase subunit J [Gemmatimonadota bacterium]|nr:NADH-quinone oxidoreductase subunit J [Gemmatimonadota bacterium]